MQTEQLSPEDEALATELLQDMLVSPEQAAQEQHVLEQQQEELRQKLGQVLVKRRDGWGSKVSVLQAALG